ncbi:hypothetical protein A3715_19280 [Oleiphilus sp. HI0009]|nr:hypothetical protein A3715_19280 [Oleiphilus sp. HI0009]
MEVTTKAANKWINGETAPRPSKWERLAEVLSKHKNYFEHLENDDYLETGEESLSYDMDREFLSVVIKLPDDDDARKTIIQTLGFGNRLHGAEITAVSAGDVIS